MPAVERFIEGLEELKTQIAVDGLSGIPSSEQNEFGFGQRVGRVEGVQLARDLIEKLISEQDQKKQRVTE